MNNSNYDSLAKKLMQSGILPSKESDKDKTIENIFEIGMKEEVADSPINEQEIKIPKALQKQTKRLNKSDLEMVSNNPEEYIYSNSFKIIKRFLNFKESLASKGALGIIENFLFAFFPRLYRAKLARDAMAKLKELNIDTNKLLDKTIPYGEGEMRYQNLIKYISYANEIQTKIKKEIN
ncbi:MAG: hypothetical protein IJB79_00355 [Candidatus Gastranaerophilales bacterium]|nr:hypothetical protein [Candidatus Gastranaerophilales bacterium]